MTPSFLIQGSPEWHAIRCGKVTASRVAEAMAKTKSGWGASRANYMAELIAERLTGVPAQRYTNDAMRWGTETEPEARRAYEEATFHTIREVGFVPHPMINDFGCSPDGLVESNGLVEIKCPFTSTHIETLLSGTVDGKYITQMQAQMACTGREYCDFVSYDPRMPVHMRLFIKRIDRDKSFIQETELAIITFLSELNQKLEQLKSKYKEVE